MSNASAFVMYMAVLILVIDRSILNEPSRRGFADNGAMSGEVHCDIEHLQRASYAYTRTFGRTRPAFLCRMQLISCI